MRLWIDDTHPAPTGFVRVKTANAAKAAIRCYSIDDFVGLFSSFDSYDGVDI